MKSFDTSFEFKDWTVTFPRSPNKHGTLSSWDLPQTEQDDDNLEMHQENLPSIDELPRGIEASRGGRSRSHF